MKLIPLLENMIFEAELMHDLRKFLHTLPKDQRDLYMSVVSPVLSSTDSNPITQRRRVLAFQHLVSGQVDHTPEYRNIKKKIDDFGVESLIMTNKQKLIVILNNLHSFLGSDATK